MLYISLIAIAENESTKSNRLELFETYTVKITNKITPTVRIASNVHAAYQSYLYWTLI